MALIRRRAASSTAVETVAPEPGAPRDDAAHGDAPASSSRRTFRVPSLDEMLDAAITAPSAVVRGQIDRLRAKHPDATPEQIIKMLERRYLLTIASTGGAVGAAAAFPSVGTGTAIALTTSQVGTFLAASAALALAVADVHGVEVDDVARRRTLVLASLLGEEGSVIVEEEVGLGTLFWARSALTRLPLATVKTVNATLARRVARYSATRGGVFFFGRLAPFGIGAVIGVTGARALGGTMIAGIRRSFGPPPATFLRPVDLAGAVVGPAGVAGTGVLGVSGAVDTAGAVVVPVAPPKGRAPRGRRAPRRSVAPPEHVDVPRI